MSTNINFDKNLGIGAAGAGISIAKEEGGPEMIFTITTTAPNEDFIIRGLSSINNYDVNWGDSNSESGVTDANKTHTYASRNLRN